MGASGFTSDSWKSYDYSIEDSLVYVEDIYLQAEQSQLPELKRVVLAYDDTVTMGQI